jgi:tetratricopeptide (TPR) repeat protein
MRLLILSVLLTVMPRVGGGVLSEAEQQYLAGQYASSAKSYLYSLSQYPQHARPIRYNISLAYLRMDSLDQAFNYLEQAAISGGDRGLSSQATNHAGVILVRKGQYPKALDYFRRALIFDPSNEMARYNYELLSKRMLPPPGQSGPQDPPGHDPDDPQPSPPDIDQETYEQLIREIQRQAWVNPNDQGIPMGDDTLTRAEALKVLEKMNAQPIQFLQQLRKKPIATPSTNDNPRW